AGLSDYLFVWFRQRRSLMMTRYEVEKEQKQDEGDPHHKSERKRLHQELLEEQMFSAIKEADLIVINPEHVAVALKEGNNGAPPKVVASGINNIARRIKKIARQEKIPIYRDVKLARSLYKLPKGEQIPPELYQAVATVLLTLEHYQEGKEDENKFKNFK
ncbi:MAG: EscU/YscU/HrcU family type III secretion system export apparatus switch protein, partial [Deltaproteobacteria bacterium]|nr:EscU/YscU/HrcU family type III secretion system export apparatus switch protein [Deltaproteobacteria bacterium]